MSAFLERQRRQKWRFFRLPSYVTRRLAKHSAASYTSRVKRNLRLNDYVRRMFVMSLRADLKTQHNMRATHKHKHKHKVRTSNIRRYHKNNKKKDDTS